MILSKPIIFFDLETTGVNVVKDKIVQIAILKIFPDGEQEQKKTLVNPGIDIPEGATEVHGITNQMVLGSPSFKQISKSLAEQMKGCDIAGYNSDVFDVPLLIEEFNRAGIEFPDTGEDINFVDVLKIERRINSHKLTETFKRYTGEELDGAHDAMNDVIGTAKVLFAQLEKMNDDDARTNDFTVEELDLFCQDERKRVDYAGKLYENDGEVYWSFGKHKDCLVKDERQYADWVLRSDFPTDTKNRIRKILSNE